MRSLAEDLLDAQLIAQRVLTAPLDACLGAKAALAAVPDTDIIDLALDITMLGSALRALGLGIDDKLDDGKSEIEAARSLLPEMREAMRRLSGIAFAVVKLSALDGVGE